MLKANIKRAQKLSDQLNEIEALQVALAGPVTVTISTIATETQPATLIVEIADADPTVRPALKTRKDNFIAGILTNCAARLADIEAEILTL